MPRGSVSTKRFETKKKNGISLRNDELLDTHLKPIKIGDINSPLELSNDELKINGDLFLNGKLSNGVIKTDQQYLELSPYQFIRFQPQVGGGYMDILLGAGDPYFVASGDEMVFTCGNATHGSTANYAFRNPDSEAIIELNASSTALRIYDDTNLNDYFDITVGAEGATTISTVDADTNVGHLILDADGMIQIDSVNANNSIDNGTFFLTSGTKFGYMTSHHSLSVFALYEAGGASSDDYFNIIVDSAGATTIGTVDANAAVGHLTIQPDGDLVLDPVSQKTIINATDGLYFDGGGDTYIEESSADSLKIWVGGTQMMLLQETTYNTVNVTNSDISLGATQKIFFDGLTSGSGGHTHISESAGDILSFTVGGSLMMKLTESTTNKIEIQLSDLEINSGKKFYLDGNTGTHTYIYESSDDIVGHVVGGDTIIQLSEKGDDGNEVSFGSSCVGFTQLEPTYDATDTVVDFRHSNKQFVTFGSGNITNLNLYMPLVSGNFVLLVKQDGTGSRTVTNYKVFEFDETSADGSYPVKFAGGSNPTLTTDANHVDILSFYWDADNEIAYGVATLDFQD